jgi:hypothetical protein
MSALTKTTSRMEDVHVFHPARLKDWLKGKLGVPAAQ